MTGGAEVRGKIVKIGNSRGIRIPKPLLEQTGLIGEVELVVEGNALVIRPLHRPRQGWAKAAEEMASLGDDAPLDSDVNAQTDWDAEEWQWE
jgi:antitoxin MazE